MAGFRRAQRTAPHAVNGTLTVHRARMAVALMARRLKLPGEFDGRSDNDWNQSAETKREASCHVK